MPTYVDTRGGNAQQANINTTQQVAGLKEDLQMVGNQYNIVLSVTTAGQVFRQEPPFSIHR